MSSKKVIEEGNQFMPQFAGNGLIPAIAQDARSGQVLMVAYMNQEALSLTMETGFAVYYSRSRQKLWRKGEQSGHQQKIQEILVDCDQDCLILKVSVDSGQCHTGHQSCFYRKLAPGSTSELRVISEKVFDPDKAYHK